MLTISELVLSESSHRQRSAGLTKMNQMGGRILSRSHVPLMTAVQTVAWKRLEEAV